MDRELNTVRERSGARLNCMGWSIHPSSGRGAAAVAGHRLGPAGDHHQLPRGGHCPAGWPEAEAEGPEREERRGPGQQGPAGRPPAGPGPGPPHQQRDLCRLTGGHGAPRAEAGGVARATSGIPSGLAGVLLRPVGAPKRKCRSRLRRRMGHGRQHRNLGCPPKPPPGHGASGAGPDEECAEKGHKGIK